jgi:DNA-binding NtrC family response regulator
MLLVDDNAAYRDMTEMALSSLGYSIVTCDSPDAALEIVRDDAGLQLLITDVVMAKMNGVQLAAEIRRTRPDMKVLFCSGYSAAALTRQGVDLTRGEFLMKPISLAALSAKIAGLLSSTPEDS